MNTREKHIPIGLIIAASLAIGIEEGFGLTQFKDGGTHNMISTINDDVWVDFQTPGLGTTVNLLAGGTIMSPYRLQGFHDSKLNISDGYVYQVFANNYTQVTMSGGSLDSLIGYNNSRVTMTGGSVGDLSGGRGLFSKGNSHVTMLGGWAGVLAAQDNGQVTMSGGSVLSLDAADAGHLTISGGSVAYDLRAGNSSRVTISGGSVGGFLLAYGDSTTVIWSGGTINSELDLVGNANLTIVGYGFAVDGSPFPSGTITSLLGGNIGFEPHRRITGWLANGDVLNNEFKIGDAASITIIPEPCTYSLLALGGILLRLRKWTCKRAA